MNNKSSPILLALLCGLLLLAGCAAPPPAGDPYTLIDSGYRQLTATAQTARQTQSALNNEAQATRQAIDNQEAAWQTQATATAAAFESIQTQQAATVQVVQTAQAGSVQATATAAALAGLIADVTATQEAQATGQAVAATQTALTLTAQEAKVQRERVITWAWWALFFAALALALYLAFYTVRAWGEVKRKQGAWVEGAGAFVFNGNNGAVFTLTPRRMFSPAAILDGQTVTAPPMAPGLLLQERTTQRAQLVELARAAGLSGRQLLPSVGEEQPHAPPAALPAAAPWEILKDWRGAGLPLGMSASGLLTADPETNPHLLMAGTSGSGKTRYGLRPVITGALAGGWQVFIFDRSGLDFLPFKDHPNCYLILLADAAQAVGYLQALYDEIQRRFTMLREAEVSTWGRMPGDPGPRLLAVFDEFSNLADALDNKKRESLWRWARMIAAEGRKAGVHLALALQDPTHKSLDLRIRRNATPLAFRVRDDAASRVVLGAGGADQLQDRQFLTVMQSELHQGTAFAPSDGEITQFLAGRAAPSLAAPAWMPAASSVPQTSVNGPTDAVPQIRALRAQGASLNVIQRTIFGFVGGKAYYDVKDALAGWQPEDDPK